jgi:hypothetical protein
MRVTRLGPALWKLHAAAHPYLLIRLTNLQRPQRFAGTDSGTRIELPYRQDMPASIAPQKPQRVGSPAWA